jgi:hypothetical protein
MIRRLFGIQRTPYALRCQSANGSASAWSRTLQMAMSQDKCPQLKPSPVHHSITGMIVHNDPGGAFFVQGGAPLPVLWAPMPLPGLLQTSSSFADGMRALARSEQFSSFRLFVFLWVQMHRERCGLSHTSQSAPLATTDSAEEHA